MAATAATKRASRPRTVAPKATTKTEVSVNNTKPSIWTRVKTTASKTVAIIVKPFKAVAAKSKPVTAKITKTTKTVVAKIVKTVKAVIAKIAPVSTKFWARSLKPLLLGIIGGVALFGLVVASIVAPFTTVLALALSGGLVIGLSLGVKYLEEHETTSRFARIALSILDVVVRTGIVLVYAAAALFVAALCATSFTFLVFSSMFLALTYLQVRGAASISFMAWAVVSGNWTLALLWALLFVARIPARSIAVDVTVPEYSEIRRKPEVHEDVRRAGQQPAQPTGNFLRAKGTEELWGTEHDRDPNATDPNWSEVWVNDSACNGCGSNDGATRVATDGPIATHGLCSKCFDLQCEEDALRFTGVSLKARSVEVRLNQTGIEHSKEFSASKFDPTSFHWMESAWWRDRSGAEYAREKLCLMDGREVARVVHDYKRKVYRASVLGQLVRNGVKTTWEMAQSTAQDELNDERAAVRRYEEAAEEVVGEAPARHVLKRV